MERFAWPKNLSSRGKQAIKELLDGQNPTKKIRHLFDAHSQTGNNTAQPLFGEDLIVSCLGSFSNTLSPSSGADESYEVSQVPTNACVRSEVSEGSVSINTPVPRTTSDTCTRLDLNSTPTTDDQDFLECQLRDYAEVGICELVNLQPSAQPFGSMSMPVHTHVARSSSLLMPIGQPQARRLVIGESGGSRSPVLQANMGKSVPSTGLFGGACVRSEVSEGSESCHTPVPVSSFWPTPPPLPPPPQPSFSTSSQPWIFVIFWGSFVDGYHASTSASVVPVLGWCGGYYKGEEDKSKGKAKISTSSAAEQKHRKRVRRDLTSLIARPSAGTPDDAVDEEVTEMEWFFLASRTRSFGNDGSLLGQAFFNWKPIWVSGGDRLEDCGCERAKQGRIAGLQTMVCIPVIGGVVELGSTELINGVVELGSTEFIFPSSIHVETNIYLRSSSVA